MAGSVDNKDTAEEDLNANGSEDNEDFLVMEGPIVDGLEDNENSLMEGFSVDRLEGNEDRVEVKEGLPLESIEYTVEDPLPASCESAINRKSTKNTNNL